MDIFGPLVGGGGYNLPVSGWWLMAPDGCGWRRVAVGCGREWWVVVGVFGWWHGLV